MIKKSIGFNWGPSAVGNTYWKGVPLRLLLNRAGIHAPGPGARFVCLAGPEGELPKSYDGQDGGPGSYGTSIDMETALDPTCDVIVAFEQNGERLHPDHGFPCRVLIPGYIGGRMIKFLTKVIVTDGESKNFYHFNDNRVLPVGVDAETATADGWWFKEEYIINNLNINGAIAYPKHEEVIPAAAKTYTIKGYAYSGGGRKVIRAEVSFDQGQSWKLGDVVVREKPRWAAGSSGDKAKHWCWCHWEIKVDASAIASANEICFRAFDQSQNSMPERPTWNVMGMLNNPWYRVRVHSHPSGGVILEHPTVAGPTPGGWMQKMAAVRLLPIRPRSRGERRFLRTFRAGFNARSTRPHPPSAGKERRRIAVGVGRRGGTRGAAEADRAGVGGGGGRRDETRRDETTRARLILTVINLPS
jgi:DMSO/TMAO reductase YedYZ molybdopterin-dependent catalytic subunit